MWTTRNSEGYEAPVGIATDVVVLTVVRGVLTTLLVRRPEGSVALPGGFVGPTERPCDTALRKLYEKTGMKEVYLEQLATFADPGRDFRGWIPSIAYLALVPAETTFSDDTAEWTPARNPPPLAFDHAGILAKALDRVEGKLWWSNVAVGILPDAFSMAEARSVYEAVAETQYDPATFARDLQATGLVEPVGRRRAAARGRPALLYRFSSRDLRWGSGRRKRIKAQGA